MKKSLRIVLLFFAAALLLSASANAQQREVRIHSHGQQVHSFTATGANRMYFSHGNAVFTHNGDEWPIAISQLDSITFGWSEHEDDSDTAAVDFANAVVIIWDGSSVSVSNPYSSQIDIAHNGGHVVISSTIDEADITYILRGASSDGSVTMTTDKKFVFCLDGLRLAHPAGPAIKIASDKRCALHLMDTSILSDGAGNTDKAALQARGKLLFQGDGLLQVSGLAKHAIQSSGRTTLCKGTILVPTAANDGLNVDDFVMHGGTLIVNSLGDGVDGDQGFILIDGGVLDITCPADDVKGLSCDSTLTIGGGEISVTVGGAQSKAVKTKSDMLITGGSLSVHADGTVAMEDDGSGQEPSYCTGIKVGGNLRILGGSTAVVCPAANAGGKAVNVDGSIVINDGIIDLTAIGPCAKYTNSDGSYSSYSSTCIKSNGDISITGGSIALTAGGRGLSCDGGYSQSGGVVEASTSADGFATIGSGSSCTDGFAPACLSCNGNVVFTGGFFTAASTGKGGRGIVADGTLAIGRLGDDDSLLTISVTTGGAPVNTTSGGGGWPGGGSSASWKGLAKGFKIQDTIHIFSGHVMAYCSQTGGDPTAEAIESKGAIVIDGGIVEANAYDDAINAGTLLAINGGRVWAYSRGNDGIDCNGSNTYLSGGTVIVTGRETGIDANADRGGNLCLNGGTVVVQGGSMGAWDTPSAGSSQKYLSLGGSGGGWPGGGSGGSSVNASNGFCIMQGSDTVMVFKAPAVSGSGFQPEGKLLPPPGGGSAIAVSTPAVVSGSSYDLYPSVTITDGIHWHGLYSSSDCATSGSPTSLTPR